MEEYIQNSDGEKNVSQDYYVQPRYNSEIKATGMHF